MIYNKVQYFSEIHVKNIQSNEGNLIFNKKNNKVMCARQRKKMPPIVCSAWHMGD